MVLSHMDQWPYLVYRNSFYLSPYIMQNITLGQICVSVAFELSIINMTQLLFHDFYSLPSIWWNRFLDLSSSAYWWHPILTPPVTLPRGLMQLLNNMGGGKISVESQMSKVKRRNYPRTSAVILQYSIITVIIMLSSRIQEGLKPMENRTLQPPLSQAVQKDIIVHGVETHRKAQQGCSFPVQSKAVSIQTLVRSWKWWK